MDRRSALKALPALLVTPVAGCSDTITADTPTPTPTSTDQTTVRVGPNSPGCPGDSWGQMGVTTDEVDSSVASADDARQTVIDNHGGSRDDYYLVEPRPDVIKWQTQRINLHDRYDAETWYLFDGASGAGLVGILVVPVTPSSAKLVQFFVGDC